MFGTRDAAVAWLRRRGASTRRLCRLEEPYQASVAGQAVRTDRARHLQSTTTCTDSCGQIERRRSILSGRTFRYMVYDRTVIRSDFNTTMCLLRELHALKRPYWLAQNDLSGVPLLLLPVDFMVVISALSSLMLAFVSPVVALLFAAMVAVGVVAETVIHATTLRSMLSVLPDRPGIYRQKLRVFRSRRALERWLEHGDTESFIEPLTPE